MSSPVQVDAAQAKTVLAIQGMTCAGCASKIESSLRRLEGVTSAGVNFGTRTALISHRQDLPQDQLGKAISRLGYQATLTGIGAPAAQVTSASGTTVGETAGLAATELAATGQTRAERSALVHWVVSAPLALFAMLVSMIGPLQFTGWRWVLAGTATVVVWWGGWSFLCTAWQRLRHGATAMDTLISLAALSAWSWSLATLLFSFNPGWRRCGGRRQRSDSVF